MKSGVYFLGFISDFWEVVLEFVFCNLLYTNL